MDDAESEIKQYKDSFEYEDSFFIDEALLGAVDWHFLEVCPICFEVLSDPVKLDYCRHIFCRDCLNPPADSVTLKCPKCENDDNLDADVLDPIRDFDFWKKMNGLGVVCISKGSDGEQCNWKGPRYQFLTHIRSCSKTASGIKPIDDDDDDSDYDTTPLIITTSRREKGKEEEEDEEDEEEEIDMFLKERESIIPDDKAMLLIDYLQDYGSRSGFEDTKTADREVYSGSRLDLNPHMLQFILSDKIPILNTGGVSHEEMMESCGSDSDDDDDNRRRFRGAFDRQSADQQKRKGRLFSLTEYGSEYNAENCLFSLPPEFSPIEFFQYDFEAFLTSEKIIALGSGHLSSKRMIQMVWKVIPSDEREIVAHSIPWCRGIWDSILKYVRTNRRDIKLTNQTFYSKTLLPSRCYDSEDRLSEIYTKYVVRTIEPSLLDKIMASAAVKRYFFSEEIDYIYNNWVPSLECVVALKPKALIILHNILHENGDPQIKRDHFASLFLRPQSTSLVRDASAFAMSSSSSSPSSSLSEIGEESVASLFTWKTKIHTWPFPTFHPSAYGAVQRLVFSKCPAAYDDHAKAEIDLFNIIENQMQDGDTCVDFQTVRRKAVRRSRTLITVGLNSLQNGMNAVFKVDLSSSSGSSSDDSAARMRAPARSVVVRSDVHDRTLMLAESIKHMMDQYVTERIIGDGGIVESEQMLFHQIHWYPAYHPRALLQFIARGDIIPSSEQQRALNYVKKLPLVLIDGFAGTGKTELFRMVLQAYDPASKLYITANAAAAQEVGAEVVCERSITAHRFLVLHSMYCTWRKDPYQKMSVMQFLDRKADRAKPWHWIRIQFTRQIKSITVNLWIFISHAVH